MKWTSKQKIKNEYIFQKIAQYFGLKDKPSSGAKRKMKMTLKVRYK